MRHSKFLIFAAISLALGFLVSMWDFAYSKGIEQGRIHISHVGLWESIIAESINEKPIYLSIDGRMMEIAQGTIYMDEMMNLMLPVSMLRDNFNCSSYLPYYDFAALVDV